MWLARPIYEVLPYLYMLIGVVLLATAWFVSASARPGLFLLAGSVSTILGLVLWLKRKDYRTRQTEYNSRSLDE